MTTITDVPSYMKLVGSQAKAAAAVLATADTQTKNHALSCIKQALIEQKQAVLDANTIDVKAGQDNGLEASLLDRLVLNDARFDGMIASLDDVIVLPDPVGEISQMTYRPSGIQLGKMRVPLGVVGMIYESRPNVTIEAASLAIKSGNAIILRGGSEAYHSNQAIAACIHAGLKIAGVPQDVVQVLATTDRSAVDSLITMKESVDVVIPRGGKGLIERISRGASVPVIKHLDGNCHTYIDKDANHDMAIKVATNAKTSRYGTCNTMETLLVHETVAKELLPAITQAMMAADSAMQFRLCSMSHEILGQGDAYQMASEDDWYAEYLAPILAVKVVSSLDDAINHINHYGSHHTDVIITENYTTANVFVRRVDSSSVMVNASSRFADGFEYGLGAEIGISTDKIHARGPVGLHGLTSEKWVVFGYGEVRT
ncbi:glutamate-5-semialdehyde dehydrogenase [uncultured Moraxella sp.]|uniref:glutamate-5-semialdehyde dehydrogenase n=1 Tax=uncultured Moraxella sp. TaxID=263769 RepID=UPI0025CC5420|nr:glutamate-5-semialdehyde dehydrogenase [uncultured Moraxella sp.]